MENSRSEDFFFFNQGKCFSLGGLSCAYNTRLLLLKSDWLALKKMTVDTWGKCNELYINIRGDKGNYPWFLWAPVSHVK